MKSFSTISLFILLVLLGSAFTDKCKSCESLTSTDCEETEIECSDAKCLTFSQYYYNDGDVFHSIKKGCANTAPCGVFASMTQENVQIRVYTSCCNGELCNNDKFYLPPDDTTLNGKTCPSCYSKGTVDECVSDKSMKCLGTEVQCLDYRGTVQNPDQTVANYSVKTCINPNACKYKFDVLLEIKEKYRALLAC
ncbi:ly6/PLAUR domain-containing protein 8-like [Mixophyes fleayi]|uniref:ly6/PLAUR domain-containing protein 8-like n=1 Tax=Mixophyes fleayi TaxID=3061075 RepID=UPI003F4DEC28